MLAATHVAEFQETVWQYYRRHGRQLPWRDRTDAYTVLVSELMLQQTQVARVVPKFTAFMAAFPDWATLAAAPLSAVLAAWSGLGYNRRALFLHKAAQQIVASGGAMPSTVAALVALPGIGPNTAGAIMNYAYNIPTVFIETNIRTVYLHHFYADATQPVDDRELRAVVAETMDQEHPREWFWAVMDYGAHLKATAGGRLQQSKHYKKQPPLKGSVREMRGRILKALTKQPLTRAQLIRAVAGDERFVPALTALAHEGLVESHGTTWGLTGHSKPS